MSKTHPRTQEEWEEFRFPQRPTLSVPPSSDEDDEEGDGGGEDGGWGDAAYEPQPPRITTWVYVPEQRRFVHLTRHKQVLIDRLDEGTKVVRLVAVFQAQSLDPDGFLDALERAAALHHGCTLTELLRTHADGRLLLWPEVDLGFDAEDDEPPVEDEPTPRRPAPFGH